MEDKSIDQRIPVPTIFTAMAADAAKDPFVLAVDAARTHGEPGTLIWTPRPDRADCGIVLGPETSLADAVCVSYVTMVAAGDTLAALMPPGIPLVFGWPDRIVVNGNASGGVRVGWPETTVANEIPTWMVTGIRLWVMPDDRTEYRGPDTTTLREEGCADLSGREFLESFARHFLYWTDRWLEEGFAPVKSAWLSRAANYGPNMNMELRTPWAERRLTVMDDTGDICYVENGKRTRARLLDALQRPSWPADS